MSGMRSRILQWWIPVAPSAISTSDPIAKHARNDHAIACLTFGMRDGEHEEDREPHEVLDIEQRVDRKRGAERPFAFHRPHSARLQRKVEQRQRENDRVGPAARAKRRLRPPRTAQSERDARDHCDEWQYQAREKFEPHPESVDELNSVAGRKGQLSNCRVRCVRVTQRALTTSSRRGVATP